MGRTVRDAISLGARINLPVPAVVSPLAAPDQSSAEGIAAICFLDDNHQSNDEAILATADGTVLVDYQEGSIVQTFPAVECRGSVIRSVKCSPRSNRVLVTTTNSCCVLDPAMSGATDPVAVLRVSPNFTSRAATRYTLEALKQKRHFRQPPRSTEIVDAGWIQISGEETVVVVTTDSGAWLWRPDTNTRVEFGGENEWTLVQLGEMLQSRFSQVGLTTSSMGDFFIIDGQGYESSETPGPCMSFGDMYECQSNMALSADASLLAFSTDTTRKTVMIYKREGVSMTKAAR